MKKHKIATMVLAILVLILVAGCSKKEEDTVIRIGIPNNASSVAPLRIVDKLNLLEKYVSGVKLELIVIESSTANNEALIAGSIDGAAINNTNFLIGSEKGIPYKIFTTLSYGSTSIQTNDPEVFSRCLDR